MFVKVNGDPKCCADCPLLNTDGDYPTCNATGDSSGYDFPTHSKRMRGCPIVEDIPNDVERKADNLNLHLNDILQYFPDGQKLTIYAKILTDISLIFSVQVFSDDCFNKSSDRTMWLMSMDLKVETMHSDSNGGITIYCMPKRLVEIWEDR